MNFDEVFGEVDRRTKNNKLDLVVGTQIPQKVCVQNRVKLNLFPPSPFLAATPQSGVPQNEY